MRGRLPKYLGALLFVVCASIRSSTQASISSDYNLEPIIISDGGGSIQSESYSSVGSIGGFIDASSSPIATVQPGFIAQLSSSPSGNHPPVAGADSVARLNNTRVAKVLISTLLANDFDLESDPLSLAGAQDATPAGSSVVIAGAFVVYTAPAIDSGNGSFTYWLSDGPGGHLVNVLVPVIETTAIPTNGPNATGIVKTGNDYIVTFLGVPAHQYRVQYTTSSASPYIWNEFNPLAIYTVPANGVFSHLDISPTQPFKLYRGVSHP